MISDSLVTELKFDSVNRGPGASEGDSIFWTDPTGQMCVQNFRPAEDIHYQPHTHAEYSIVVCLAGEMFKTQGHKTFVIGPGETMIGNPGVEHASGYVGRNGDSCETICLSLAPRLVGRLADEFNLPPVDLSQCPAFTGKVQNRILHECAQTLAEELRGDRPGGKIIIQTLATRLLVETLRSWPRANIERIPTDPAPRLPRRDFVRAYEFMRWCRKENFRLQHLCQMLGSSQERFTRLFLASTRHTPASFYNRMLLERALELLQNPRLSIKEIGFELGFKTSSHFIAAFRREFDRSPQDYRENVGRN
jgi:AraC-like DNA-binding protein/quercetin dioxygenase-like cupin family protein